jgi:DNA invertase Pin-like site-specific DNA recombinase
VTRLEPVKFCTAVRSCKTRVLQGVDRGAGGSGFSIEGQAEKLRAYAELNDLGEVTVIADPGWSGKNLERPGLQQLLAMVEAGHVSHVLTWRLDRVSRNLGDLILLADTFGDAGVALHSFTEKIDLSSATGRMFYNILGSFAQFYREQLAENVRMGMQQAVREGKWVNRPKTGYDLVDGKLVPNEDAPTVQEIFRLRGRRQELSGDRGPHRGPLLDCARDPAVTDLSRRGAAERRVVSGAPRSPPHRDGVPGCSASPRPGPTTRLRPAVGSGGLRAMWAPHGHRVQRRCTGHVPLPPSRSGLRSPRRASKGLHRAALLGLRLLVDDVELQEAIRAELSTSTRRPAVKAGRRDSNTPAQELGELADRRRKLLELHYADRISADLFAEEERSITRQIEMIREEVSGRKAEEVARDDLAARFEQVALTLRSLEVERVWSVATDAEKKVLLEEIVEKGRSSPITSR